MRHIRHAIEDVSTLPATYFCHPGDFLTCSPEEWFRFEFYRLSTFAKLESLPVSPIRLDESGFDIVCFSCGVSKRHWNARETTVALIHLRLSESCAKANFRETRNVPVKQRYPNVSSPTVCGLSQESANSDQRHGESSDARGPSLTPSSPSSFMIPSHPQGARGSSFRSPQPVPRRAAKHVNWVEAFNSHQGVQRSVQTRQE